MTMFRTFAPFQFFGGKSTGPIAVSKSSSAMYPAPCCQTGIRQANAFTPFHLRFRANRFRNNSRAHRLLNCNSSARLPARPPDYFPPAPIPPAARIFFPNIPPGPPGQSPPAPPPTARSRQKAKNKAKTRARIHLAQCAEPSGPIQVNSRRTAIFRFLPPHTFRSGGYSQIENQKS